MRIIQGDCREVVRGLEPVDAVVCDPPYGLKFMGKGWDHGVPGVEFWTAIMGAMKPGAHLLAFGGTRTYHRLGCAIEDAGFEMRDCLMWVYGSGFPKSLDVGKAIDKSAGKTRVVVGIRKRMGGPAGMTSEKGWNDGPMKDDDATVIETAPATDAAKQWDGWGTALKPAWEPIIMARKPLEGTVAANVLKYGVGGLNIDGCRVGTEDVRATVRGGGRNLKQWRTGKGDMVTGSACGRWPANLLHDGSQEVLDLFPETRARGNTSPTKKNKSNGVTGWGVRADGPTDPGDTGTAARFFYCAKASKRERGDGNTHPTVKPIALMRYLCRLVTPPGGTVLDPFMGSGSTLVAAQAEGFDAIGIDTEEAYCEIAAKRVEVVGGSRVSRAP